MIAKLSVICSRQENGSYFAICPELNGCFTQGDAEELQEDERHEILKSQTKIFSELEIVI